jgi:hypothetical protein
MLVLEESSGTLERKLEMNDSAIGTPGTSDFTGNLPSVGFSLEGLDRVKRLISGALISEDVARRVVAYGARARLRRSTCH